MRPFGIVPWETVPLSSGKPCEAHTMAREQSRSERRTISVDGDTLPLGASFSRACGASRA